MRRGELRVASVTRELAVFFFLLCFKRGESAILSLSPPHSLDLFLFHFFLEREGFDEDVNGRLGVTLSTTACKNNLLIKFVKIIKIIFSIVAPSRNEWNDNKATAI